jgi:O-antigen/teichoic acid export membrane protein
MSAPDPAPGGVLSLPLSIFRRLRHDALWSLAGNLLTVGSGLATLKIIGRFVETSQYGAASLVLGLVALLNQLIANPLLA